jgi:hypothetical protein
MAVGKRRFSITDKELREAVKLTSSKSRAPIRIFDNTLEELMREVRK